MFAYRAADENDGGGGKTEKKHIKIKFKMNLKVIASEFVPKILLASSFFGGIIIEKVYKKLS